MTVISLIIKAISDLTFLVLLLVFSLGLGKRVWSLFFKKPHTPVEIFEEGIFCVCLGLGALSLIVLIIGLSGFLSFWSVFCVLALGFVFFFKDIKGYILDIFTHKGGLFSSPVLHSVYFWILSPFLIAALTGLFLSSRVPPLFYDALVYHLGIPSQYIIQKAIRFMPNSFHSHHPFLVQNLFTVCLLMGGYGTTKLLVFVFAILNAIALSLFAIRLYKGSLSWLAGVIFLLTPTMLIMGSLVNADLGFSLYTLLALYALCMWVCERGEKWLILSAAMAGLSLGTKYIAIIYCFGICLLCLFFILIRERKGFGSLGRTVGIYIVIALFIGSGWFIKNYMWTGNPFYPKWAYMWGNPKIPRGAIDSFYASAHAYDSENPVRNRILSIPAELIFHPERFGVGGNIGPLFLLLFPLALIPDRKNPVFPLLVFYCCLYFIAWAFTFRMTRFALPLFAIIILLSINTLERIYNSRYKRACVLICMVFLIGFSYNLYYSVSLFSYIYDPIKYLKGEETVDSYLSRKIPVYPVFRYINNNLPQDSLILFLGETVNFYCFRRVIAPTAYDVNPFITLLKETKTDNGIVEGLKKMGVTHLLVNFSEMERLERSFNTYMLNEKDKRLMDAFVRKSHILYSLYSHGNIMLVKI